MRHATQDRQETPDPARGISLIRHDRQSRTLAAQAEDGRANRGAPDPRGSVQMTAYMIGSRCFEIGQARSPRAGTDTVALAVKAGDGTPAGQPALSFAGLLRRLRAEARLTQEELAEAAGLSPRSISDLERGVNLTARKDTALLLADAL